jgi:hypothetical protein
VILRDSQGNLRYWWPGSNEYIFKTPFLVSNSSDMTCLVKKLNKTDFAMQAWRQRPSSGWSLYRIVNMRYYVTGLTFPLGRGQMLPQFIKRSRAIISLECDASSGKLYEDNLCAFRCLAYHFTKFTNIESKTREYLHVWEQKHGAIQKGVQLENIPDFEDLFEVGVNIYELQEEGVVETVYRSTKRDGNILNVNLYNKHLSYIKDFQMYAKKYKCRNCDKLY